MCIELEYLFHKTRQIVVNVIVANFNAASYPSALLRMTVKIYNVNPCRTNNTNILHYCVREVIFST